PGPSSTPISRLNCGSHTPWRCSTFFSIFFSGVAKFIASAAAAMVATIVRAMVQLMGGVPGWRGSGWGASRPACATPAGARSGSVRARREPFLQRHSQPDVRRLVVVVDQALAVAVEDLQAAAHRQRLVDREAPVELQRAARAVAAAQRMARHQREIV